MLLRAEEELLLVATGACVWFRFFMVAVEGWKIFEMINVLHWRMENVKKFILTKTSNHLNLCKWHENQYCGENNIMPLLHYGSHEHKHTLPAIGISPILAMQCRKSSKYNSIHTEIVQFSLILCYRGAIHVAICVCELMIMLVYSRASYPFCMWYLPVAGRLFFFWNEFARANKRRRYLELF